VEERTLCPFVMRQARYTLWLGSAAVLVLLLSWHEISRLPDGKFHAYIFDVGQGDSVLLVTPTGRQILVDGGPDFSALERLGEYMPFFDRSIDLLVLTHPHEDHLAAFPAILERYRIHGILTAEDCAPHTGRLRALFDLAARFTVPLHIVSVGTRIHLNDGTSLKVLWPPHEQRDALTANDRSVVLSARSGSGSILLTGDISQQSEKSLLASGTNMRADVLKVPHHGSTTSSCTGFLLAVSPQLAIVSSGEGNSFGHPNPATVARYEALHIPLLNTQDSGTIPVMFYGTPDR